MGTMGPDEVKSFVTEAVQTLDQVTDTLTAVATEVPATEEPGISESPTEEKPSIDSAPDFSGAEPTNDTEEPPIPKTANMDKEHDGAEGDDPEKEEMKQNIASLNSKIASMIRIGEVKELATKYASLWPIKQQASKFASFSKSKESIQILTARLKEAESLMSHSKVASSNKVFSPETISSGLYSQEGSQKSASMNSGKAQIFVNV
jgi:hypothetical protein